MIFQSTLPAKGATCGGRCPNKDCMISIHAPREGSDILAVLAGARQTISIHAPREGSDALIAWMMQ